YQILVRELTNLGISVKEGVFRANMGVELINDGPVTIWLDTLDLVKGKRTSA
ncbi:MAG: D-aminoacyl-tRNA deacylase, partial [Thermoguttaceae bacterium]|nr:D-aminoacyl-tRNA deacylase [Thermoguttaceae bacterium]